MITSIMGNQYHNSTVWFFFILTLPFLVRCLNLFSVFEEGKYFKFDYTIEMSFVMYEFLEEETQCIIFKAKLDTHLFLITYYKIIS